MKGVIRLALVAFSGALIGLAALGCVPEHHGKKKEAAGAGAGVKVIPGPGQPGYDEDLDLQEDLIFRQFSLLNSAGIGVGFNDLVVRYGNDEDKDILTRWFLQWPEIEDFGDFCAQDPTCNGKYQQLVDNPRDGISGIIYSFGGNGDTGMFGGVAIAADLLRYAVMRDEGYPPEEVEAARRRAIHVLDVIDIGARISGVPGVLVRGLRRLDHGPAWPPGDYTPCPASPTPPPSTPKWNTWHEDTSLGCTDGGTALPGLYPDWAWQDNASKDQVDGWMFAFGVAWDVIAEDPSIPDYYREMLQTHARNFAENLMSYDPEFGSDMTIRDADGKLTQWCDLNPHILNLEGCWSAGYTPEPINPFNAIMGLGAIKVLHHITGDEKIRDFYYKELIGNRKWHIFLRDAELPYVDFTYATNYSNVNMIFIAFYNVLRYESDPEVRQVIQQAFERLWDNGRNNRQPKHINQTFFDVMYSGLSMKGPAPGEMAEGIETLKQWPDMPMWAKTIINCDEQELAQGECLAVDNQTIIELPVKKDPDLYQYYTGTGEICAGKQKHGLGHNDEIVAETVVPRRLRGDSNFDWRSNPFQVNFCRNPYEINAVGDWMAAFWLGRFLTNETGPMRNLSPVARYPELPEAPSGLVATAKSEQQIDLAWTDSTNKEDYFVIERKKADVGEFEVIAQADRDATSYTDTGLDPGTTYLYRLKAVNDVGESGYSNIAAAATQLKPETPPNSAANLVAAALDHQSIKLTWDDMSDNESGFKVVRDDLGTVAILLADVTEFTDTGLEDGTTYTYTIVAFNSAGDAFPSNSASARTVELPGIRPLSPQADETNVPIDTTISVEFDPPITEPQLTFLVKDEVAQIDGSWVLQGGGATAVFTPDKLLTMSTQYTVIAAVDGFTVEYNFFTQGPDWVLDLGQAQGLSFAMNVFRANITEPAAAAGLLGGLLGAEPIYLILGVLNTDAVNNQMTIIGALGDTEGPDPTAQDMNSPTILFPEAADFQTNHFQMGPFLFPIAIQGYLVSLDNVMLEGYFGPDYAYLGNASLEGDLDLRVVISAIGENPDDYIPTICGIAEGVCTACADDPNRVECIHLRIEDIRGELRKDQNGDPIPVIPIAAVSGVASGTGDTRTIELTLTDPETGAPQPDIDISLFVDTGDGVFVQNGDTAIIVRTDQEGKAYVDLQDTTGGLDVLKADINEATTPVPYMWVRSTINVSFD